MVTFTARQNLANLNEIKMNLIVKFSNLAGKSYTYGTVLHINDETELSQIEHGRILGRRE